LRLFPDIETTTSRAVLTHMLRARDLYLLNPRVRDVEPTYVFNGFTSTFEESTSKFRQCSTFDTVMLPLHNYFAVLLAHHPGAHELPVFLLSYLTQLQMLTTDYTNTTPCFSTAAVAKWKCPVTIPLGWL
jgi:hypothetical protein